MKNTLRSKNLPLVATGIPAAFCNPKTKTTSSLKGFLTLVMMVLGANVAMGQVSIISLPQTYTQDFDAALGTTAISPWTNNSTVVGWYITSTNLPINTGSTNSNSCYNFGNTGTNAITDRALGALSSSTSHRFGVRLKNNSSNSIISFNISFTGEQWRAFNSGLLTFDYQIGTTVTSITSGTFTAATAFNFTSLQTSVGTTLDGNAPANRTSISGTLTVNVAVGSEIMFRWNRTTSSSPGLAIDDFSITANGTSSTWNGTAWSNGAPTSSLDAIIAGNYSTTTNGVFSAKTLTVNSGKSFTINTGHNITVAGAVTNGGTLTIANNANLVQTDVAATNTGSITVNRNSASIQLYDYTLWSSPVASQQLQAFSTSTLASRFYTYYSSTNQYNPVSSTTSFAAGTGYLIRAPNDHPATPTIWNGVFTGVPNNGDVPFTMSVGASGFRYNLVGNPYPSPITISTFVSDNTTNITGTLYFWRKTNGTGTAYCTYTGSTFTTNGNTQSANPNGIIQTGQGFFVEATGAGTALTFKNSQRVSNTANQFFKSNLIENNRIWLNATNTSGAFSQMAVGYMTDATLDVDSLDGKYINDSPFALTSIINSEEYTIQGKPLPFETNDTVPLGFKTNAVGNFSIGIDHVDGLFSNGQTIYLKDNLTNTTHNLSSGAYSFASDAGTYNSRFEIVYQSALALPTLTANNVIVYSQNGEVTINSGKTPMNQVRIFDVRGRLLAEKNHINATETKLTVGAQNQVLLVKIGTTEGGEVTKKIIQ